MKVKGFIASLLLTACAQTAWAQKMVLHLSNNQKVEYSILQVDSITMKDAPNGSDIVIINDLWDVIQYYGAFFKLKEYIEKQKPGILFYNKDYVPAKGGQDWDMYLKCFNAQINEGDSTYTIMALNYEAWDKAIRKLEPLYRYPNRYEDKVKGDKGETYIRNITDPDSLANLSIGMDITSPMIFNRKEQPEDKSYLVSTHGDTLRGDAVAWIMDIPHHTPNCGASKGDCYEVRNWAMPKEWYFPDVEVEIDDKSFYNKEWSTYYKAGENTRKINFDSNQFADITDKYGHVSHNDFFYLDPLGPTSNPQVEVKLTNKIMSGKYDVYVVMVPWWYSRLGEEGFADSIRNKQGFADSISAISKMSFTAQLRYNNNATNGKDVNSKKSEVIEYDGTKVDTIRVFEDFEFPYSYKNLRYSYPTLILNGATKATSVKKGFIYSLCIDRIILKSKEEE